MDYRENRFHNQICLIQSLRGVGFLSAVVLIAEMGSFELFSSLKNFMPTLDWILL